MARLNASPVGEKPKGESSTIAPMSSVLRDACDIHLAHQPAVLKVHPVHDTYRAAR